MKFTLSWLKDHLETDATLDQICERLTMIGLEVESLDDKAGLRPFTIAKVLTAIRHPDADKLQVLSVDNGSGKPIQVVCGAPNARAGLIGVLGNPGDYVPGLNVTLGIGKIRGVESFGMMCSESELQLSDSHDGIIELPEDAPIGQSYATWAHLDDPMIEINLTPNRPDCTSIHGIARDLAASGLGTLKTKSIQAVKGNGPCPVSVKIEAPELCPGFALRLVRGVKNGPSPKWMQQRLIAIGLRPINALVDITNYLTFDRGRPLHVFDAKKVAGNLVVRRGKEGDEILALDGKTYKLTSENCVISDDNGVESIAGVMGGEHSGCDENTTDVLIESALWAPLNIAKTGRTLGIITDARYRFERGVDPEMMRQGLELATEMVRNLCGGEPSDVLVEGYTKAEPKVISFPYADVKRLTGIEVSKAESQSILTRLGFEVSPSWRVNILQKPAQESHEVKFMFRMTDYEQDTELKVVPDPEVLNVAVPSWRPDVDGKADLVEEVMRINGVDNIAPQPLAALGTVNTRILTTLQIRTRLAKRTLAARGMMEALTWSFISAGNAALFGGGKPELKLANPIAADMSDMRPSLLPGLIAAAQRNADRGFNDVALFEVSGIYENDTPEGQRRVAGGVRRGTAGIAIQGRSWAGNAPSVSVHHAKADALAVLEACGLSADKVQIEVGAPSHFHPGRSGVIKQGPKIILGYFGEFHPKVLEALKADGPLCGFEVYVDALPEPKARAVRTKPRLDLSPLQALKRDFAFVVSKETLAGAVLKAAQGADKKLITSATVFDIFEGTSIGEGKKSIAIEITIQPQDKTLAEDELEALSKRIVEGVTKATGGALRG